MTHTPGPERSAIYELLRYGRKHDGPWTEAITGDQLIDEEYADMFTAAPDMLAALRELAKAEEEYREEHEQYGDGYSTARRWDKMRRAGDAAREVLKRIDGQEEPR